MLVLNTELRLRFQKRKPRQFNRAASADDASQSLEAAEKNNNNNNGVVSMSTYTFQ
ncbi:GH24526 [Drosophila grimshawi]|uniref:GH24526 n=1 Tax=Drosophila grimshawi TaxID=7222 RepID=B4JLV1_DROGR|nr:GH24526 [Drosophila grimshawi]